MSDIQQNHLNILKKRIKDKEYPPEVKELVLETISLHEGSIKLDSDTKNNLNKVKVLLDEVKFHVLDLDNKSSKFKKYYFAGLVLYIFIIVIPLSFYYGVVKYGVPASILNEEIVKLIINDADLNSLTYFYKNTPVAKRYIITSPFYGEESTLADVFQSIKLNELRTDKPDLSLISKIENLHKQYVLINPFDKLTKEQKNNFESIKYRAGVSYDLIKDDLNKIAKDMEFNNSLVTEYLNSSSLSLFISQLGLFLALLIPLLQYNWGRLMTYLNLVSGKFKDNITKIDTGE